MLSEAQRVLIRATVPLLETGGEALTTHFYQLMLREYPQVRPLFNQAHQASGAQPRALADGVLTYARHIDRLEALGPLASRIVNKHVALQIQPEHYPIVGTCLLRAIREVLGPRVATDEVIDAWSAAYGQLAQLLIQAESAAYDAKAASPGGWRGGRAFRVASKVRESAEITSFHLEPVDGGAVTDFQPGQYIGLQLWVNGEEIRRTYSLSAAPNGRSYRISVKREPGGKASNHLHDTVAPGHELTVFPPSGEFVLRPSDKPLVLISAGVGITPTLAMLESSLPKARPITFIHYARNAQVHAFADTLRTWTTQRPDLQVRTVYEHVDPTEARQPDAVGRPTLEHLRQWLPANGDAEVHFLGPKPFMACIKRMLHELGVPPTQCHYEFFGPAEALQ